MKKIFLITLIFFFILIFFTQINLIDHPVTDNDEGIYQTTFILLKNNFSAYKEVILSQPPGFILSVYPGFLLFGEALQASRLTILLWTLLGLSAVVWMMKMLEAEWAGLLVISLLYLVPIFFNQTLILQSDMLVVVFSSICLTAIIRYSKDFKVLWLVVASIFLNFSFWIKYDISLIPGILFAIGLFYYEKKLTSKQIYRVLAIFICISAIFFLFFIYPFGLNDVVKNTIGLRLKALSYFSVSPFLFLSYLKQDILLTLLVVIGISFSIINKDRLKFPAIMFLIWELTVIFFLIIYRPLFPHHLSLLALPATIVFSYQMTKLLRHQKKILVGISLILILVSVGYQVYRVIQTPDEILNPQQKSALQIIFENTKSGDYVISDEAILNAFSGRLPPPTLADISFVRVKTGDISYVNFQKNLNIYKPKLIISFNGRLESMNQFKSTLSDYRLLTTIADTKRIYIRKDNK